MNQNNLSNVFRLSLNLYQTRNQQSSYGFHTFNCEKDNYPVFDNFCKNHQEIRILICITMYNENKALLNKTLDGIIKNITEFSSYGITKEEIQKLKRSFIALEDLKE